MAFLRSHRFKRNPNTAHVRVTERDIQIIRLINRHRFLRSHHLVALVGGSPQGVLRRLQLLYHHGYLERPRAQLTYYHQGGSRHIVYGLGNKGAQLLKQEVGSAASKVSWSDKNRSVGRVFLAHALLVSDVMVAIEISCRKDGRVRLIQQNELIAERKHKPFRWRVQVNSSLRLGVVPDQVFALEFPDDQRAYFFLEADRGTMPVTRRRLYQTSFYRKLLAYEATWSQNLHRSRFGFHRFRVLTVTTNTARLNNLIDACSRLKRGRGLFLFAEQSTDNLLGPVWRTGIRGKTASLLD